MPLNRDSSYKCSLGPEALEKAQKELKEDPKTRLLEVKNLRERLEKVPGLKCRTDVPFLLQFLRARKFDQERAFQMVKNHYASRRENPDFYMDIKPSRTRLVVDVEAFEVLEHRSKDGCSVLVCRPVPTAMYNDLIKGPSTAGKAEKEEDTQVNGVHILVLLNGFAWRQASHLTPSIAKEVFNILQDVVPLRLRRLDYVQEPTFWDVVFAVLKPFLKEKLQKRIGFIGEDYKKLHAYISPEFLPTDLGGKLPVNSNFSKAWMSSLMASEAQFETDNKFGFVDMGISDGDIVSKSGDAGMAGLGGTFKKLEI